MTLVVQVKALAWLRRSSTTFIRPLCLNCMSGLRRPLQRATPAFAARRAGLWRRIVEQEDRLLLRQSVVSADLVLFLPKIITFIEHFKGNGSGSPMIVQRPCLSSSKKLSIWSFK